MLPLEKIDPLVRTIRQRLGTVNLPNSWQGDFQLTYVLNGKGFFEKDGRRYELVPGSLFFFLPYQRYVFASEDPSFELIFALFDIAPDVPGIPIRQRIKSKPESAYDVVFPRGVGLPVHLSFEPGGQVEIMASEMVHAWGHDLLLGRYRAKVLLQRLLVLAMEHQMREGSPHVQPRSATQSRLENTLAYMVKHAASPLTIPQLAARAELSVSHFIRTFRQWTGMTPADYLHYQRIEIAKRLLTDMHLSIKQIAQRAGYPDPFHFSRVFRKLEGQSPSAYRQSMILRMEETAESS